MLKNRVIPTLLLLNGRMVKGKNFSNYRETGNPNTAVRIYSSQDADELAFIDIKPNKASRKSLISIVESASEECFMPLLVGGGISTIDDIKELVAAGADKVLITTSAYQNESFLKNAIDKFGAQCIVTGIDYKNVDGELCSFLNSGTRNIGTHPLDLALQLNEIGIGEIFLNSIDRDGCMQGYDIDLIKKISSRINCPLIAAGGAGNFEHLCQTFLNTNVSALSCASLFHFGDNNPIRARSYLRNKNIPVRNLRTSLV